MILGHIAAITGSELRSTRHTALFCIITSGIAKTAATCTLIPVLGAMAAEETGPMWRWVGTLLLLLATGWALEAIAMRAGLVLGETVLYETRHRGLAGIGELDPALVAGRTATRLRSAVTTAGPESVSVMLLLILPLVHGVLTIPVLAVLLIPVSPWLGLAAAIGGVALLGALVASRRLVASAERRWSEAGRDFDEAAIEFAWAQPTLRAAGVAGHRLEGLLATTRSRGLRLLAWQIPGEGLFSTALNLTLLLFGVTAGRLYLDAVIDGATAAALVVILLRVVEATGSLSLLATPLASAERTLREIRELPAAKGTYAHSPTMPGEPAAPAMLLRGVRCSYPDGTEALRGIDLELPTGSTTVVVGASGSGKSTLLDVLCGLRAVDTGEILRDGAPADATALRAGAAVVFQDTWLPPGALRTSVGGADADDARLAEVAQAAGLTGMLRDLPRGWDSPIGDGGTTLSGGERQRVGLARALLKPAGILLIDEGTSALDTGTEGDIIDALRQLRGSRTMVLVTHRPAPLAIADRIVVLDRGRIVEQGPPAQLQGAGGALDALLAQWSYPTSR